MIRAGFKFLILSNMWVAAGLSLLVLPSAHALSVPYDWRVPVLGFFTAFLIYSIDRRIDILLEEWEPSSETIKYYHSNLFWVLNLGSIVGIFLIFLISPRLIPMATIACITTVLVYNFRLIPPRLNFSNQWCRVKDLPGAKAWYVSSLCAGAAVFSPLFFLDNIRGVDFLTGWITFLFFFALISCNAHMYDIRDLKIDQRNNIETLPLMVGTTRTIRILHLINFTATITILSGWVLDFYPLHPEFVLWNLGTTMYLVFISEKSTRFTFDLFIDGTLFLPSIYLLIFQC